MKTAIAKVAEFSAPKWKLYGWITKSLHSNKSVLTEFYLKCPIRESYWDSCTFDSRSELSPCKQTRTDIGYVLLYILLCICGQFPQANRWKGQGYQFSAN